MTTSIKEILDSFEQLPELEKKQVASEILKRTIQLDFPPISDEELINNAEELFLELDKRELENEQSQ